MHTLSRRPLTALLLLAVLPGNELRSTRQVHAPPPRRVNRPPLVVSSLPPNAPLLRDGPFPVALSTPADPEDDLAFVVTVSDPDGDSVSLELAEPFEGLSLEWLGGSDGQASFQIRFR